GTIQYLNNRTGAAVAPITGDPSRGSVLLNPLRLFTADTISGYAEVSIPVIAPRHRIPLVNGLEVFGSGRTSTEQRSTLRTLTTDPLTGFPATFEPFDYDTHPHVYMAGFKVELLQGLTLRTSVSRGFRPPNLTQVTPTSPPTSSRAVTDRLRNE